MNLFDETESKYYELISYLLLQKRDFTGAEIDKIYHELFVGEMDFDTIDALFSRKEDQGILFDFNEGRYSAISQDKFPVLCNEIERQAFRTLSGMKYADLFLEPGTINKLRKAAEDIQPLWENEDIHIKNQHNRINYRNDSEKGKLRIIVDAIANNKAIIFDNKKEGSYSYTDSYAFPVRIEYSVLNDTFRISAYKPDQNRFIKMTLETMSNIRLGTECRETLQEDYKKFLACNKKTVVLDVEPVNHVIERCFRIFSYYERKAVYDREDGRYRLEIVYYSYDEAEVVRDILSLGSSVIVLEPVELRKKIYERILAANELYTCQK